VDNFSTSAHVDVSRDHGEYLDEAETSSGAVAETNGDADQPDADMTHEDANNVEHLVQADSQQQVRDHRAVPLTEPCLTQSRHRIHHSRNRPSQSPLTIRRGRKGLMQPQCHRLCSEQVCSSHRFLGPAKRFEETLTGNALT